MISFMTQVISVERPSFVDDGHGNFDPDFSGVVPFFVSGCSVQPGASVEDVQNRAGARISWTVYAPAESDIRYLDRVVIGGNKYRLTGEPERWDSPGGLSHLKFFLERWADG